jgi:NitT/TauT family transport system permease protein
MPGIKPDAERRAQRSWRLPRAFDSLLAFLAILLVWEAGVRLWNVPIYLLPPPSLIVERMIVDYRLILFHAATTAGEVMAGFLLSILVSVPLAAALAQYEWLERALYPLLVASQTIPKVAIAPLLVVWFGFGLAPKILIAFLICFFPIVIDTLIGFRSIPKEVLWLSRSMGASRRNTFLKIQIPAALPNIFAGIKVASTLAVVGAVVAEFVGADRGLGYELIVANGLFDVRLSFAILAMLSLIGIALYSVVDMIERWLLPWHVSQHRISAAKLGGWK